MTREWNPDRYVDVRIHTYSHVGGEWSRQMTVRSARDSCKPLFCTYVLSYRDVCRDIEESFSTDSNPGDTSSLERWAWRINYKRNPLETEFVVYCQSPSCTVFRCPRMIVVSVRNQRKKGVSRFSRLMRSWSCGIQVEFNLPGNLDMSSLQLGRIMFTDCMGIIQRTKRYLWQSVFCN